MNRIFFLVIGIIGFLIYTNCTVAQEFNAGVYGGIVASQVDGDSYGGYNKAGLITGAYVNRFFNKQWAGQMGLRYIQKGSQFVNDNIETYYKTQFHYIEMPFTVRFFYHKKVDFEGGLAVAYLIKDLEAKHNDLILEEADPSFNNIDFSSVFGLAYHFNKKLSIAAHFAYSLIPIRAYFPNFDSIKGGQYNNVLYFTLEYKLSSWR